MMTSSREMFTEEVSNFSSENPILTALAEAERAIDGYLVPACDGDDRAGKIVTRASLVKKTAELLRRVRPSPGDLVILTHGVSDLRKLVGS